MTARVTCPVCGRRDVALTPKTGVIGRHVDPRDGSPYYRPCEGSGRLPDAQVRRLELELLAVLVFRYPARARELVAQLPL